MHYHLDEPRRIFTPLKRNIYLVFNTIRCGIVHLILVGMAYHNNYINNKFNIIAETAISTRIGTTPHPILITKYMFRFNGLKTLLTSSK